MSVASMGTFFDLNGNAEYVRGTSRASTLSARLMHRVEKKKKKGTTKPVQANKRARNRSYIISYLQSRILIISTILPNGISVLYNLLHILSIGTKMVTKGVSINERDAIRQFSSIHEQSSTNP